jgi:hypothetical protein
MTDDTDTIGRGNNETDTTGRGNSDTDTTGRGNDETDTTGRGDGDAVREALVAAQSAHGAPAVSPGEVEPLLGAEDGTDTPVGERLDAAAADGAISRLETDAGPIYWAPESDGSTGNWWQRLHRVADAMLRTSAVLFALALGVIFADGPVLSFEASADLLWAAEMGFLVAIASVLLALVFVAVTLLGDRAARRGWVPAEFSVPWPF